MSFSVHHIRRHKVLLCPITGDATFYCLAKMISGKFFQCKVNKNFVLVS